MFLCGLNTCWNFSFRRVLCLDDDAMLACAFVFRGTMKLPFDMLGTLEVRCCLGVCWFPLPGMLRLTGTKPLHCFARRKTPRAPSGVTSKIDTRCRPTGTMTFGSSSVRLWYGKMQQRRHSIPDASAALRLRWAGPRVGLCAHVPWLPFRLCAEASPQSPAVAGNG